MIRTINLKTMREEKAPPCTVLCLGNFDGVHIGHRALARETVLKKEALAASFPAIVGGVFFFDPPPSRFLADTPVPQLTATEEKLTHFKKLGLDFAFLADFSALRHLSPKGFVNEVMKKACGCEHAVCGYNFRFAENASGDAETLFSLMDGRVSILDPVTLDGKSISSSIIRALLAKGDIEEANRMLGYPFGLSARVDRGKALGKKLGVPTVNQHFAHGKVRPMDGIYVSRTWIGDKLYPSVSNIGTRPTFDDGDNVNCETHIIGFEGDLYGQLVHVEFAKRQRGEIRFPSTQALQAQLRADIEAAALYFENQRRQI